MGNFIQRLAIRSIYGHTYRKIMYAEYQVCNKIH